MRFDNVDINNNFKMYLMLYNEGNQCSVLGCRNNVRDKNLFCNEHRNFVLDQLVDKLKFIKRKKDWIQEE